MKRVIYILFGILALSIFMYVQSQYIIDSKQLELDLSDYINENISITYEAPLLKTTTSYFVFQGATSKGIAILKKHSWSDKWKVEFVHRHLTEPTAQIIKTNRGNYIVAMGESFSEEVQLKDGKTVEMTVLYKEMSLYISKETLAKRYEIDDLVQRIRE